MIRSFPDTLNHWICWMHCLISQIFQWNHAESHERTYSDIARKRSLQNKGFSRSLPGLKSDHSVSSDLQRMQNNGVYNRQAQYDYDSERSSLLQDPRTPDSLMGDSQRSSYYIEQASHVNDAYVPELDHSLRQGSSRRSLNVFLDEHINQNSWLFGNNLINHSVFCSLS